MLTASVLQKKRRGGGGGGNQVKKNAVLLWQYKVQILNEYPLSEATNITKTKNDRNTTTYLSVGWEGFCPYRQKDQFLCFYHSLFL